MTGRRPLRSADLEPQRCVVGKLVAGDIPGGVQLRLEARQEGPGSLVVEHVVEL